MPDNEDLEEELSLPERIDPNNLTVPALFNHCVEVWDRMREDSQPSSILEGDEPVPIDLWEGFLTRLFRDLRLAVPQYTKVMQCLQQMDCVRQIRRGGGSAMSQWAIIQRPTLEMFRHRFGTTYKSKPSAALAQNSQMLRDLAKRISELEGWKENHERLCKYPVSMGGSETLSEVLQSWGADSEEPSGAQDHEPT